MSKHTPAPWLIAGEDKTFVYALGPMEANKFWAHVQAAGPEKISKEEAEANASLIAAAPELLDLLIQSQESIGGDWRERRDALIAKATGSAPSTPSQKVD